MPYGNKSAYKKRSCYKMKGPSLYKKDSAMKMKPCPGCGKMCPGCKGKKY